MLSRERASTRKMLSRERASTRKMLSSVACRLVQQLGPGQTQEACVGRQAWPDAIKGLLSRGTRPAWAYYHAEQGLLGPVITRSKACVGLVLA